MEFGEIIHLAPPTFNMSRGLISQNNLRHTQTHCSNEICAHVSKNHLPASPVVLKKIEYHSVYKFPVCQVPCNSFH